MSKFYDVQYLRLYDLKKLSFSIDLGISLVNSL